SGHRVLPDPRVLREPTKRRLAAKIVIRRKRAAVLGTGDHRSGDQHRRTRRTAWPSTCQNWQVPSSPPAPRDRRESTAPTCVTDTEHVHERAPARSEEHTSELQ